jgi:hypothetical protein
MAPSRPTPPRQQQRLQQMGVAVRPGTAGPNRIQRPTAVPSGSAYALAGQESERFLARPSEDAAHVSRSGTQPTRLNGTHPYDLRCSGTEAVTCPDSAANSRSPDTTLQDSDEAYEQWVAEGKKACTTCKRKHPPPCRGRKRKAREPTVSRRGKGFPRDHCFACGESHPWPDKDGTLYHTKCPPFWVKPPEATNESPVAAAAPRRRADLRAACSREVSRTSSIGSSTSPDGSTRVNTLTRAPDGASSSRQQGIRRSDE